MERSGVHPQQEPSRATSSGSKQTPPARKLRESCIGCSSSKVKCNKEKPTCSRCVRRGLSCEYMVSRRTGRIRVIGVEKPSSSSATSATSTISTTRTVASVPQTPKAQPSNEHHPASAVSAPSANTITSGNSSSSSGIGPSSRANPSNITASQSSPKSPSGPLHSPPPEPELWTAILSPNTTESTDLSSLLSLNSDIGQLFASLTPAHLDSDGLDAPLDADAVDHPSVPCADAMLMQGVEGGSDFLSAMESSLKPNPCCLTICLEILTRLFPNAPVDCERPGSQDGPSKLSTIESVIADNKEIIDTVQTVLHCRCAQDEYVATLVSLIVFKLMGWYLAAARDRSSLSTHDGGTMMDWENHRPSTSTSFEEQVLHLPTIVGAYCVDGHHQNRMAAQLVLSELHRVQRLVTLVGRRLEGLRHRNTTFDSSPSTSTSSNSASSSVLDFGGSPRMLLSPNHSPFSSNTLAHLEDDLRKRLRVISSETIDILRRA